MIFIVSGIDANTLLILVRSCIAIIITSVDIKVSIIGRFGHIFGKQVN